MKLMLRLLKESMNLKHKEYYDSSTPYFSFNFQPTQRKNLKKRLYFINLQLHNITTYSIDNEIDYDDIMCINYHAKDIEEFFSYLDIIGVQYSKSNDYYIFQKKQK
jgi:hypothetical protein